MVFIYESRRRPLPLGFGYETKKQGILYELEHNESITKEKPYYTRISANKPLTEELIYDYELTDLKLRELNRKEREILRFLEMYVPDVRTGKYTLIKNSVKTAERVLEAIKFYAPPASADVKRILLKYKPDVIAIAGMNDSTRNRYDLLNKIKEIIEDIKLNPVSSRDTGTGIGKDTSMITFEELKNKMQKAKLEDKSNYSGWSFLAERKGKLGEYEVVAKSNGHASLSSLWASIKPPSTKTRADCYKHLHDLRKTAVSSKYIQKDTPEVWVKWLEDRHDLQKDKKPRERLKGTHSIVKYKLMLKDYGFKGFTDYWDHLEKPEDLKKIERFLVYVTKQQPDDPDDPSAGHYRFTAIDKLKTEDFTRYDELANIAKNYLFADLQSFWDWWTMPADLATQKSDKRKQILLDYIKTKYSEYKGDKIYAGIYEELITEVKNSKLWHRTDIDDLFRKRKENIEAVIKLTQEGKIKMMRSIPEQQMAWTESRQTTLF